MVLDDGVISSISPSGAEKKQLVRRSWQWQEVPFRNKVLNYMTYVHLCVSYPGCCDGEADPSAGAEQGEAIRSSAGLVMLVRCGCVMGHTA